MTKHKDIRSIPSDWTATVLVCRKCSRRLGGGFGPDGDRTLAKALRRELAPGGKGKPRKMPAGIVEVGCLDICPKGSVVALNADRPEQWLLVPRGAPIDAVVERLGLATRA